MLEIRSLSLNPRLGVRFLKADILKQRKNKNKQSDGSHGKLLFHTKLVSRIFKLKLGVQEDRPNDACRISSVNSVLTRECRKLVLVFFLRDCKHTSAWIHRRTNAPRFWFSQTIIYSPQKIAFPKLGKLGSRLGETREHWSTTLPTLVVPVHVELK